MKTKLLHDQDERTFAVIFDKGDEPMSGLLNFARSQKLKASHFTAIGAFSEAILGYFSRESKEYKKFPFGNRSRCFPRWEIFPLRMVNPRYMPTWWLESPMVQPMEVIFWRPGCGLHSRLLLLNRQPIYNVNTMRRQVWH